jgi:Cu(I)/Ag(I) efflux system membrane protein CusA/SilA
MIAGLIRWSARNILLIALASIFLTLAGVYAVSRVPLDAIPDLSDVQVIIYTEYPGQAPQVVEDQVTYPLTTAMLSVPKSRVVRGFSFFGVSFVYIIFEDGTDLYWARSRVLEYLSSAARRLPAGVEATELAGSTNTSCAARRRTWPSCERSRIGTSAMASLNRGAWPRSPASAGSSNNIAS